MLTVGQPGPIQRRAYYAPVLDGKLRLDMGVFQRRCDAEELAKIAIAMLPDGRHGWRVDRVWIARERT